MIAGFYFFIDESFDDSSRNVKDLYANFRFFRASVPNYGLIVKWIGVVLFDKEYPWDFSFFDSSAWDMQICGNY